MISVYDKKDDCCGCTACEHICPTNAIKMVPDEEGFLYPETDQELCIDCGKCIESCAFQKGYDVSDNYKNPNVYALKHKLDDVRKKSSSGGAFTAISDYILSEGGVIYGAAFDETMAVLHKRAETASERNKFRGSKYVQSNLNDVYSQVKKDLKDDRIVLFTGTGCQAAGLKRYLMKSNVNVEKLLLVDFICHGTPSPLVFKDFITYLEKNNKTKVVQYKFRSKIMGWGHTEEAIFLDGRNDYKSTRSQLYKQLFYANLCIRPSCHACRYANMVRPSDITIADFWGIDNYFPEFKDSLGVSAVIINTSKGAKVYSKIVDNIESISSTIEDCSSGQRNLREPTPVNPRREAFWSDYHRNGFEYIAKKYAGYNLKSIIKKNLKAILSRSGLLKAMKK